MAYPGYGGAGGPPQGGYPGNYPYAGGQPPAAGYSSGFPAAGFPAQQDPLWVYFSAVAGQDGQISPRELQSCLTQSGFGGTYKPFSLETCRLMISMLDRDYSGQMGFNEYKELMSVLNQWKTTFMTYDRDRSGTCELAELQAAIVSFGYNLTPQCYAVLLRRYSENGRITFDEFIACIIRLRCLTDHFQRRDTTRTGNAQFTYNDFLSITMSL